MRQITELPLNFSLAGVAEFFEVLDVQGDCYNVVGLFCTQAAFDIFYVYWPYYYNSPHAPAPKSIVDTLLRRDVRMVRQTHLYLDPEFIKEEQFKILTKRKFLLAGQEIPITIIPGDGLVFEVEFKKQYA